MLPFSYIPVVRLSGAEKRSMDLFPTNQLARVCRFSFQFAKSVLVKPNPLEWSDMFIIMYGQFRDIDNVSSSNDASARSDFSQRIRDKMEMFVISIAPAFALRFVSLRHLTL